MRTVYDRSNGSKRQRQGSGNTGGREHPSSRFRSSLAEPERAVPKYAHGREHIVNVHTSIGRSPSLSRRAEEVGMITHSSASMSSSRSGYSFHSSVPGDASAGVFPFGSHLSGPISRMKAQEGSVLEIEYALHSTVSTLLAREVSECMQRAGFKHRTYCDLIFNHSDRSSKSSVRFRSGERPTVKTVVQDPRCLRTHGGTAWYLKVKRESPMDKTEWASPIPPDDVSECADAIAAHFEPGSVILDEYTALCERKLVRLKRRGESHAFTSEGALVPLSGHEKLRSVIESADIVYVSRRWDMDGPSGALQMSVYERHVASKHRSTWYVQRPPEGRCWTLEIEVLDASKGVEDILSDMDRFCAVCNPLRVFVHVGATRKVPERTLTGRSSVLSATPDHSAAALSGDGRRGGLSWVRLWPRPDVPTGGMRPRVMDFTSRGAASNGRALSVESKALGDIAKEYTCTQTYTPRPISTRFGAWLETVGTKSVKRAPHSDSVDALCHNQPYKLCLSFEELEKELGDILPMRGTAETVRFMMKNRRVGVLVVVRKSKIERFCPFFAYSYRNPYNTPGCGEQTYFNGTLVCDAPQDQLWSMGQLCPLHYALIMGVERAGRAGDVDIDFILNPRDGAILKRKGATEQHATEDMATLFDVEEEEDQVRAVCIPILSQFSSPDHVDVGIPCKPDVELGTKGYFVPHGPLGEGRPPVPPWKIQIPDWRERKPCALFRGSLTGPTHDPALNHRFRLCKLSVDPENSGCMDCRLTAWTTRKRIYKGRVSDPPPYPEGSGLAVMSERMDYASQVQYRGAFLIEGNQAANRFGTLLYLGFLVFRIKESCECPRSWIDSYAQSGVHYVEVETPEDAPRVVREYLTGEKSEEGRQIAERGRALAVRILTPEGISSHVSTILLSGERHPKD